MASFKNEAPLSMNKQEVTIKQFSNKEQYSEEFPGFATGKARNQDIKSDKNF